MYISSNKRESETITQRDNYSALFTQHVHLYYREVSKHFLHKKTKRRRKKKDEEEEKNNYSACAWSSILVSMGEMVVGGE